MSTTTLYTRIKNKIDSFDNWKVFTQPLLAGEIAIVQVETGSTVINPVTGKTEPVVELLMKVGDGTTAFNSLPWLSAKASDVYNWAKKPTAAEVPVSIVTGDTIEQDTLGNWLKTVYTSAVSANALASAVDSKIDLDENESVKSAIAAAIKGLTKTASDQGNFVKSITSADGQVKVNYGNISETDLPDISASKIIVTAANGNEPAVTLASKIIDIDSKLIAYDTTLKGGVHFIGEVTFPVDLSENLTTKNVTIDGETHEATDGDIVLQGSKEFIWVKNTWKELGDLTRVGALEKWSQELDVADTAATSQFVTAVSQLDGRISVSRAQPTTSDIKYAEGTTLSAFLADHLTQFDSLDTKIDITDTDKTVTGAIRNAIEALDANDPAVLNNATASAFISAIKQENGKITATKANLPTASTTTAGIMTLGAEGGAANYTDVTAIESNYLWVNADNKLRIGKTGQDEIIFDCGGVN